MYWKLTFAGIRHRRFRAASSALLIAIGILPVLLAAAIGAHRAAANSVIGPVSHRFASAFLIACMAITFVSMWSTVRHRRHEVGILRFLGASRPFVITVVFGESAAIGLSGAILAVPMAQSMLTLLTVVSAARPPYSIGLEWCLVTSLGITGAAVAGAAIPCAVALQRDVLDLLDWD